MNRHNTSFTSAQSRYDAMTPPEDDHADAVAREAEQIASDADKVRELVEDSIGCDDPCCDSGWARDLLIALRGSKPILDLLCDGYRLVDAMDNASGADHFCTLLHCSATADTWIAGLIDDAAEQEVSKREDEE